MTRILRRLACHGTVWCCQYQDGPMCNSEVDPHRTGRWRVRRINRKENDDNDPDV